MAVSGVGPDSHTHLQLGAGVFLCGVAANGTSQQIRQSVREALADPARCLGATAGGGSFSAVPKLRRFERDGLRAAAAGDLHVDGWEVTLSATLCEITGDNLGRALPTSETDGDGVLRLRNALAADDYLGGLCWLGELLDGRQVLIALHNALCVSGAGLRFADGETGSLPVVFKAHQDAGRPTYAPCDIIFLEAEAG